MSGPRSYVLPIVAALAICACETRPTVPVDDSIPAWLEPQIAQGGRFPPVIEQVTYRGRPAYHTIATDRYDTGDEHSLYSADGALICRSGGIAGQVSSGACEIDGIIYVRTLYDPK